MRIAVQALPRDRASWLALAQRVEASGYDALYGADHPGSGPSPFVSLAAAAAVTDRIQLAPCVINAGVWEPMALASEVATLDVLSDGRALLGIGAGHTPSEWTSSGRPYPSAGARVDRLEELVSATVALLGSSEAVDVEGAHVQLVSARLEAPRPVQSPVPVMVGGGGKRVLSLAARAADLVGLTGLGKTLPDGHSHSVDWSPQHLERTVSLVRSVAEGAGRTQPPGLEALVQFVEITDDAEAVAASVADEVEGLSAADLLGTPYAWIGTVAEIRSNLARLEAEHGIDGYVVRAHQLDAVDEVLAQPSS